MKRLLALVTLGLGLLVVPATPSNAVGRTVTVHIDPSYQQPEFQGWGTSLVWMANATGGYPDEIRKRLVDLVFGADGLNLNIARYNIGGGNAPTVRKDYMKAGATMPGFWNAPPTYGPNDKDWWNPDEETDWNWDADANQRWWVDQIKDRVDRWEAFSNSPPWFQTVSGYVSGGFNATSEQIRADQVDAFATYLVRVAQHIEQAHGITFDTIDPLNEPNTNFWSTTLGPDGQPTGGRQEGAHAGPAMQATVVRALKAALAKTSIRAVVSAPDETNPSTFVTDWNGFPADARAAVDQLNTHTYGTASRTSARDLAKADDKRLWMSEVEGSYLTGGTSYTSMVPGLGIASQIVNDIRELEPSAWVLWQPIEDAGPQQAGGGNWGSIHVPFTCTAADTLATCPVQTNTKFWTIQNFTHYIRPGDHMVKVDDTASLAAVNRSGAVLVHVNAEPTAQTVTVDLSGFADIDARATVTPIVTTSDGTGVHGLVRGAPVFVAGRSATLTVPAQSVTTLVIDGVSGVAKDAALVQPGHAYRLRGVQNTRSLAGTVMRTDAASLDELWSVPKLTSGMTDRERYALVNASTRKRLAVRAGATVLEDDTGPPDVSAQWIMSTTGDGTWTFVNAGTRQLLQTNGDAVSTGTPNSAANQRWAVLDETVTTTDPVRTYTVPGRAPTLPDTVGARYRSGGPATLPVTWQLPAASSWLQPGTVTVPGTATDLLGRQLPATAVVSVDTFTATRPGRAKAYVGGAPDLPATVAGVGAHGGTAELPVSWDPVPAGAFDSQGVVSVHGTARVVDGSTLDATVRVQVTPPSELNSALDDGVTAGATFTESGYSAAALRNGVTAEKAWSNWKPGTKDPSETVTFTLPRARDLTHVTVYFFRDSSTGGGIAASVRVQLRRPDGSCADASADVPVGTDGSPVVDVPLTNGGPTTAVCVVFTPRPNGYLTVGEIQLYAKTPGVSADPSAAAIQVDGTTIAGFDPGTTSYRVTSAIPERSTVTAIAADPYASVTVVRQVGSSSSLLWTVTVTSEDGLRTLTYQVQLVKPPRGS
jgi:O-glycosyl hydrolase